MDGGMAVAAGVLLLGLGLLIGGGGLLMWGNARRARIRDTPRGQAKGARPGTRVKLVGRLSTRTPVRTPLSDVNCLYYQLRVSEREGDIWREILRESEYAEGWVLEDASGRIGLEPAEASFMSLSVREYAMGGFFDVSGGQPGTLSRYAHLSDKRMNLREERLDVGATVVVLGQVALSERGPVLVGGRKLEVFQGTEKEVLGYKGSDLMSWVLLAAGVLFCIGGGAGLLEEPEPLPVIEDKPLGPRAPRDTDGWSD